MFEHHNIDTAFLFSVQQTVEDKQLGVPGVCNFVDARTKWLDGAVKAALDDGFTQVQQEFSELHC